MNPGDVVSHYRIVSLLGSGGMGVVYLAEDLTLGRKVALKFLSRDFARDRTAVERFRREARTASALNHPSICTIHEISEHDGQPFIAMEWLEGQSLRDLLRVRRLSIDELLTLAIDVADGLDAAHRAGVVHRDIKPGNIFVLARNRAKLLDFGLAKQELAPAVASNLPTALPDAMQLTDPGVTLGTVAYMSPEQAKGEALDARSDLFSLGVVLYEAVTGATPFGGSSHAVVFHEILGKIPASPLQLNPNTPADLDRLIMKALEKDRDVRCQSAAEMLSDLKRLKRDRDSRQPVPPVSASGGTLSVSAAPAVAFPAASTATAPVSSSSDVQVAAALFKRHRTGAAIAVVALALVVAGVFYTLGTRRSGSTSVAPPDMQIRQMTFSGDAAQPAISPDGKFIAYVSGGGVWIRQTETSSNAQIAPPDSAYAVLGLTVTPDNNFVDFVRFSLIGDKPPSLWRVPLLGGVPKRLVEEVHSPVGWSPDGRQMAFVRSNATSNPTSLIVADADGRNQKVLVAGQMPELHFLTVLVPNTPILRPAWSPDGKVIAYVSTGGANGSPSRVVFVNVSDAAMRSANVVGASGVDWIDGSSLVVVGADDAGRPQMWRLSYPDGTLARVTNDVNTYRGISVAADRNTLVTARSEVRGTLWIGDGAVTEGRELSQPGLRAPQNVLAWNGDRLVFHSQGTLLSLSPDGQQPEEIVKNASSPAFSSDGRTLVYVSGNPSFSGQNPGIWKADSDGRNAVQIVPGAGIFWPTVTSDNQNVIYESFAGGILQMWIAPLAGGKPRLLNPADAAHPEISPDGKTLAFGAREKDEWFISVCDLPECAQPRHVRQIEFPRFMLHWTPDGRAIAYAAVAGGGNIFVHPLDGSPERQLTRYADGRNILDFAWSRDGKRFAIARDSVSQDIILFRGIKRAP